jgi:tyrosinase
MFKIINFLNIFKFAIFTSTVFASCFIVRSAQAQNSVPIVGDFSDSVARLNDFSLISISPFYFCHLTSSYELLGYYEGTYLPVYRNSCEGLCFAKASSPYECRPVTSYIKVNAYPNTYNRITGKVISHVTDCQCKPKRCAIQKYGYTQYIEHGDYAYDDCDRRCSCQYGKLVDCCRQRKSFTDMSFVERTRYINTLKTISTQAQYKPQYDAIVIMHQTLFSAGIHGTSAFFPWHRYHILSIENLLQSVDCRVTVPYWDWNVQAANPFGGFPWLDSNDWLGGNGNSTSNGCVTTGPFQVGQWALPNGACLTRNMNLGASFATLTDLQQLFNTYPNPIASDYNGVRVGLEAGPGMHNTVHCSIGGNMCTSYAAASPEFLLHHCNIDKNWASWQAQSSAHMSAYSGDPTIPMPGLSVVPNDMFDLNNQPGNIKVCYVKSFRWLWFTDLLATLSPAQIIDLPRTPVTTSSRDWPNVAFFNFTMIALNERARNSLPNMLSKTDLAKVNTIASSTGIGFDLTNVVSQFDATGCISQELPTNIDSRCDV